MNILQITPAGKHKRSGNHVTAQRYSRLLHELGHNVTIQSSYTGHPADLLIVLHAGHGRDTVLNFKQQYPDKPVIVVLTGTDVYIDLDKDTDRITRVLDCADALICFHDRVPRILPAACQDKCHVIYQSARPLVTPRHHVLRYFDVCIIGHLRQVKDPFCTARAVRDLSASSRIRVTHLGRALQETFRQQAEMEMQHNHRYRWLGDVPNWRVRQELARTRLMVISSLAEGGANVLSEAVMAGVPVVATAIDGNIGMLGEDYDGYYPPGDTAALRQSLITLEQCPDVLLHLHAQCDRRRHLFSYEHELQSWRNLLVQLLRCKPA